MFVIILCRYESQQLYDPQKVSVRNKFANTILFVEDYLCHVQKSWSSKDREQPKLTYQVKCFCCFFGKSQFNNIVNIMSWIFDCLCVCVFFVTLRCIWGHAIPVRKAVDKSLVLLTWDWVFKLFWSHPPLGHMLPVTGRTAYVSDRCILSRNWIHVTSVSCVHQVLTALLFWVCEENWCYHQIAPHVLSSLASASLVHQEPTSVLMKSSHHL